MLVCNDHVKDALKSLDVPHVKILKDQKSTCSFCSQKATINIFYSVPMTIWPSMICGKGKYSFLNFTFNAQTSCFFHYC